MTWNLHSFCKGCGAHKRQMPFGDSDSFWDRKPCAKCGDFRSGRFVVARQRLTLHWPFVRWQERAEGPEGDNDG